MTAFDDGRLGVWHTSVASFKPTDGITVDGYRSSASRTSGWTRTR
jgi:hypothetical protein